VHRATVGLSATAAGHAAAAAATTAASSTSTPCPFRSTKSAHSTTSSDLAVATPCTVCGHDGLHERLRIWLCELRVQRLVCEWCRYTWDGMDDWRAVQIP
jgi:hypothetical protein